MIHINDIVDHIKAMLGTTRNLELSDESIIRCLQQETLKTLSVYLPYYVTAPLNLQENKIMPGANIFYVPTKFGDDFELMSVEAVVPISGSSGNGIGSYTGSSSLQGLISSLAFQRLGNALTQAAINPETFEFLAPNQLRLPNNYTTNSAMVVYRTTHKRDFSTFPAGLYNIIQDLAVADFAIDILSIRRYYNTTNTLFAQINLDMDFYNQQPDRRRELIQQLRENQLKYSHTRKIYLA